MAAERLLPSEEPGVQRKPGGHKALDSFCSTTKIEEQKFKGADNLYQFRSYITQNS